MAIQSPRTPRCGGLITDVRLNKEEMAELGEEVARRLGVTYPERPECAILVSYLFSMG